MGLRVTMVRLIGLVQRVISSGFIVSPHAIPTTITGHGTGKKTEVLDFVHSSKANSNPYRSTTLLE